MISRKGFQQLKIFKIYTMVLLVFQKETVSTGLYPRLMVPERYIMILDRAYHLAVWWTPIFLLLPLGFLGNRPNVCPLVGLSSGWGHRGSEDKDK